jgi:hypothetical protein
MAGPGSAEWRAANDKLKLTFSAAGCNEESKKWVGNARLVMRRDWDQFPYKTSKTLGRMAAVNITCSAFPSRLFVQLLLAKRKMVWQHRVGRPADAMWPLRSVRVNRRSVRGMKMRGTFHRAFASQT